MGLTSTPSAPSTVFPNAVTPEALVPMTTGLPRRSAIARCGLSPRTMNMPGEEYIAATMRSARVGLGERGARDLAGDEREVELARLEQRHVLGRALGIARLDSHARLLRVHHLGERVAVERKTAARRCGSQNQNDEGLFHWTNAGAFGILAFCSMSWLIQSCVPVCCA